MSSSLEVNKFAGAVLTAGVVAMSAGFISYLLYHPEIPEQQAYVWESGTASEGTEEAAVEDSGPELVGPLLASASVEAGEKDAKKCAACHSFDQGGPTKIGPNLWNIVDRSIGAEDGYAYSEVLAGMSGDAWTYENLSEFLAKPKEWAPGTKMSFGGIRKVEDRADMIAYLRSLSDNPAPLPE